MSLIRLQSDADSLNYLERSVSNFTKEIINSHSKNENSRN